MCDEENNHCSFGMSLLYDPSLPNYKAKDTGEATDFTHITCFESAKIQILPGNRCNDPVEIVM